MEYCEFPGHTPQVEATHNITVASNVTEPFTIACCDACAELARAMLPAAFATALARRAVCEQPANDPLLS